MPQKSKKFRSTIKLEAEIRVHCMFHNQLKSLPDHQAYLAGETEIE